MEEQDREKLTELATGFRIFIKEWDEVKKSGFAQCGVNDNRIETLQKSYTWLRNLVISLILLILTASLGYFIGDKNGYEGKAEAGRRVLDGKSDGVGMGNQKSSKPMGAR